MYLRYQTIMLNVECKGVFTLLTSATLEHNIQNKCRPFHTVYTILSDNNNSQEKITKLIITGSYYTA
jgi:hypothetical protein